MFIAELSLDMVGANFDFDSFPSQKDKFKSGLQCYRLKNSLHKPKMLSETAWGAVTLFRHHSEQPTLI